MTIMIDARIVNQRGTLSEHCRLAASFIDGGTAWIDWAVHSHDKHYTFRDEAALLVALQQGLHGSRLVMLRRLGLFIASDRLAVLNAADLRLLARAETGSLPSASDIGARQLIANQALVTSADMKTLDTWLSAFGIADAVVFQSQDFSDRLALYELSQEPLPASATPELAQEAAHFAIEQGNTTLEFCDYYRFYIDVADTQAAPAKRAEVAYYMLSALLPLLFDHLDAPQIEGEHSPASIDALLRDTLASGRRIGFTRLSLAVQQVARYARGTDVGRDMRQTVEFFMAYAQKFLAHHRVSQGVVGQDGSMSFPIQDETATAILRLSNDTVSLDSFGERPARRV